MPATCSGLSSSLQTVFLDSPAQRGSLSRGPTGRCLPPDSASLPPARAHPALLVCTPTCPPSPVPRPEPSSPCSSSAPLPRVRLGAPGESRTGVQRALIPPWLCTQPRLVGEGCDLWRRELQGHAPSSPAETGGPTPGRLPTGPDLSSRWAGKAGTGSGRLPQPCSLSALTSVLQWPVSSRLPATDPHCGAQVFLWARPREARAEDLHGGRGRACSGDPTLTHLPSPAASSNTTATPGAACAIAPTPASAAGKQPPGPRGDDGKRGLGGSEGTPPSPSLDAPVCSPAPGTS